MKEMSRITIENISKSFGKKSALTDVSLTLESDKIYGLLGRNGAGKTTLLNIITNKIYPDNGKVIIDGESAEDNDRKQSKIYCMTEKNIHPSQMKVRDGFRWAGVFYLDFNTEYAYRLAEIFKLDTGKKITKLSSGYNTICKLIMTLASGAEVMIFDEPVLGLDAAHRDLFYRQLIEYYSENPRMIIVATHLIDEVAEILEQVIILKDGKVIIAQPIESVIRSVYSITGDSSSVDEYSRNHQVIHEIVIGTLKTATFFGKRDIIDKQVIEEFGLKVNSPRLQDVFIGLTS